MTAPIAREQCAECAGRRPVGAMTADELHAELVADGVAYHPTELRRYVLAVRRIAARRGGSVELAHLAIEDEVRAKSGHGLPLVG